MRSTCTRARPERTSSYAPRKSWCVPIVEPSTVSCFHQKRWSCAGGFGPLVAPQTTIRPAGRTAASDRAQVASPTVSTTTSTPAPVASLTAATTSPSAWSTVTSAPHSRAIASFSALLEVTIVRTPSARQISNAAVATPPPMPQMSAHSPSRTTARVTSIR